MSNEVVIYKLEGENVEFSKDEVFEVFNDLICDEDNEEKYWSGRNLMQMLTYSNWNKFRKKIEDVRDAWEQDHGKNSMNKAVFPIGKTVQYGNGAEKYHPDYDYHLSKDACYAVIMECGLSKRAVRFAKAYFLAAIKYAEEVAKHGNINAKIDKIDERIEYLVKRLNTRNSMAEINKRFASDAAKYGVKGKKLISAAHNSCYSGMYGMEADYLKAHRGIKHSDSCYETMGTEELFLNMAVKRCIKKEAQVSQPQTAEEYRKIVYAEGNDIRNELKSIGSILPENLTTDPIPAKKIEKEIKKLLEEKEQLQLINSEHKELTQ